MSDQTPEPVVTDALAARQRELQAELEHVERAQRAQAEVERRAREAERQATLSPQDAAKVAEVERRADELLERDWAEAWAPSKPEKQHPQTIIGRIVEINPRSGPSQHGTYSAIVTVRTLHGYEWAIWCNEGSALWTQLVRLRLQPGDDIACRYKGMKISHSTGNEYHDHRLVRLGGDDGTDAARVDYDQLAARALPASGQSAPTTSDGGRQVLDATTGAIIDHDDDVPF
jgi:hypothetical protein